jgi:hypothetical protein
MSHQNELDKPDVWTEGLQPQPGELTVTVPRELVGELWNVLNEYRHQVPGEWAQSHSELSDKADKLVDDLWYVLGGRKGFFGN